MSVILKNILAKISAEVSKIISKEEYNYKEKIKIQ